MTRTTLLAWTALVAVTSIVAGAALPAASLLDRWPVLGALVALAVLAAGRTVRLPGVHVQVTVSDLYVFCALFCLPAAAAPIVAFAGTAAAVLGPRARKPSLRTVFNLAAVPLSASAAAAAFQAVAETPVLSGEGFVGGLVAATVYHAVNLTLVAIAIRLEAHRPVWNTLRSVGGWTGIACLTSLVAGAGLALTITGIGTIGLVTGAAVTAPLAAYAEKAAAAQAT